MRPVQEVLENLIRDFDQDPTAGGKRMRELLYAGRDAFLAAALQVLRNVAETRGYRYLIALLAGNDLLRQCLCDPALSFSQALELVRIGMQIDPVLDTFLARHLVEEIKSRKDRADQDTARMLALLGEVSDGARLLPLLTPLLQHPNPHIRSKAALLIGRRNKSTRWLERRLEEADPRVRANAIEGLWGVDVEGVRTVLWDAAQDANNRVAGNALLGLYRLGETRVIPRILEISTGPDGLFRATAAWVMGECEDPRFQPVLGRLLADADARVRKRAFAAMGRIRQKVAALAQAAGLQVCLLDARRLADGSRRLRLATLDSAGDPAAPALPATRFILWEDARMIPEHERMGRQWPASLAVGFALPRSTGAEGAPIDQALLQCLKRKRPSDPWAIVKYASGPAGSAPAELPKFSTSIPLLRGLLEQPDLRPDLAASLLDATQRLLAAAKGLAGERHLVLVDSGADPAGEAAGWEQAGETARQNGIAVHAVSTRAEPAALLAGLCAKTNGRFVAAPPQDQVAPLLLKLCQALQYQHEITYRLAEEIREGPAVTVRVQVWCERGMAEDRCPLN